MKTSKTGINGQLRRVGQRQDLQTSIRPWPRVLTVYMKQARGVNAGSECRASCLSMDLGGG